MNDPIYVPHSEEVVTEVMTEFREFMCSPECTSESLLKSIELLNYFTYASELNEHQQGRLDGLLMEAEMRINLMAAREDHQVSEQEAVKEAIKYLTRLERELKALYHKATNSTPTYEELVEYIDKRKRWCS